MENTAIIEDNQGAEFDEIEVIHPTIEPFHKTKARVAPYSSPSDKVDYLLVADSLIEVDNDGAQHLEQEGRQGLTERRENMPPAPFERMDPPSPMMGEEEGMGTEALWVEELVTPTPTAGMGEEEFSTQTGSQKVTRRKNSFFHKRMSSGGLPWVKRTPTINEDIHESSQGLSEGSSRKKKLMTSVKVLDDENEEHQLQLPPNVAMEAAPSLNTEQRQSSFGEDQGGEERQSEPRVSIVPTKVDPEETLTAEDRSSNLQSRSSASVQSEATKAISVKSSKARELLAAALNGQTELSAREGLAGAAFAEATAARLMMEGSNPPKGLDLVLRAASHKGRSAALAAALSPENVEQQSRANHYMDLILPVKVFPNLAPPPPPPRVQKKDAPDGDLSTLGFDNTFSQCSPGHKATAAGGSGNGGNMSPLSMSSLNEILDGPEEKPVRAKKDAPEGRSPIKRRLSFLKKRTISPKKDDPPMEDPPVERNASMGMHQEPEMPPPPEANDMMDDDGSWTDASMDETGADAPPTSKSSQGSRKKKRVFRLARMAGFAGAGAGAAAVASSSSASVRSGKRSWLRRNKSRDAKSTTTDSSGPVVDHVPTPPPNVPYQSKPFQRYVANVEVDTGSKDDSRRTGSTSKEVSTVVLRVRDVDAAVQETLANAVLADETELITSFDGVKMFGQNIKTEEELEAEAQERAERGLPPPDEIPEVDTGLSKRSIKIDPQFVSAPAGEASILTARSWDSLIENDAARWEDHPRSGLRTVPDDEEFDEYDNGEKELPSPEVHYYKYTPRGGDPPQFQDEQYGASASPRSVDSDTPGLTDKYSSAEEQVIEDKYSAEEKIDGRLTVIATANSFETEAEDELMMRNDPALLDEDRDVPDTPRRRLKLGILSRIQSRRRSQQQFSPDEEDIIEEDEEEEDELTEDPVETPRSAGGTRKPRRKLKLFKHFKNKKQAREEEAPVDEVVYEDDDKDPDNLELQPTGSLTDMDRSLCEDVEVQEIDDEESVTEIPEDALKTAESEDTADMLIRNIRKQASRIIKRGRDPSSHAAEVTRGIDP